MQQVVKHIMEGDAAAYNILTERTGLVKPIGDDCHCQCKEYSRNQVFFKPPDGGLQDSLEIYPEDRPRKCGFGGTSKALDFLPEDTKAGMIQAYLDRSIDDTACSKQIYKEALNHVINEPKQWEIREINEIMNQCITGWKYFSNQRIFTEYRQTEIAFQVFRNPLQDNSPVPAKPTERTTGRTGMLPH